MSKPAIPSREEDVEEGDVVQIIDETHAWVGVLLVVDEPKPWGVQAFAVIPQNNHAPGSATRAYNRLTWGRFALVGRI